MEVMKNGKNEGYIYKLIKLWHGWPKSCHDLVCNGQNFENPQNRDTVL